eukprot:349624-Chlamydomonas_euryale.AAC.6
MWWRSSGKKALEERVSGYARSKGGTHHMGVWKLSPAARTPHKPCTCKNYKTGGVCFSLRGSKPDIKHTKRGRGTKRGEERERGGDEKERERMRGEETEEIQRMQVVKGIAPAVR